MENNPKLNISEQLQHIRMYVCIRMADKSSHKEPRPHYKETLIYVPLETIPHSTYLISALYGCQS